MKGLSLEVRVGLLVLVALGLLGGFVFALGGVDLSDGYTVYVDFKNPGNVKPGAPVNVGNVRIGRVENIEYMGGRLDEATGRRPLIRIKLRVDQDVQDTIHEDALFYVSSSSLLGEQNISVEPGDPERPVLPAGSIVEGIDPPRMDLALAMAFELLQGIHTFMRDNGDDLRDLLHGAANMVRALDRILAEHGDRIDVIIQNIETATTEVNRLLASAQNTLDSPHIQRSLRNLDRTLASVSRDIDPILSDVRGIGTKVNDTLDAIGPEERESLSAALREAGPIAESVNASIADAREIITHVREGRGTVGAILMDDEIYDDIQEMLRDLKHNPWKLFWRE